MVEETKNQNGEQTPTQSPAPLQGLTPEQQRAKTNANLKKAREVKAENKVAEEKKQKEQEENANPTQDYPNPPAGPQTPTPTEKPKEKKEKKNWVGGHSMATD